MAGDMSVQNLWNRLGVRDGNNGYNYNYDVSATTTPANPEDQVFQDKLANWKSAYDLMANTKPAVDSEAMANRGAESLAASQTAATNTLNEAAAASGFDNSGAKQSGLNSMMQKYAGLKANNERDAASAGSQAAYSHAQDLANMFMKKPVNEPGYAYGAKGSGSGAGSGGKSASGGGVSMSGMMPQIVGGGYAQANAQGQLTSQQMDQMKRGIAPKNSLPGGDQQLSNLGISKGLWA